MQVYVVEFQIGTRMLIRPSPTPNPSGWSPVNVKCLDFSRPIPSLNADIFEWKPQAVAPMLSKISLRLETPCILIFKAHYIYAQ